MRCSPAGRLVRCALTHALANSSKVASTIANLKSLQPDERNELAHLPAEFGRLTALEMLDLSGNNLVSLPDEFGGLEALTTLDLQDNQLSFLPMVLSHLGSLKEVRFKGNPFLKDKKWWGFVHIGFVKFLRADDATRASMLAVSTVRGLPEWALRK